MTTDAPATATAAFDGTELDFWLGDWDARWGEAGRGTNRLTRILGDRVIREDFSGGGPNGHLNGLSLSVFDAERRVWRQTWVDDSGGYLDLVGDVADGCFAFRRRGPGGGSEARSTGWSSGTSSRSRSAGRGSARRTAARPGRSAGTSPTRADAA